MRAVALSVYFAACLLLGNLLGVGTVQANECEPEPASQWAPAGWKCPPAFGIGDASRYPGPGVAVNSCVFPWDACPPIAITSMQTGITVVVIPSMWCHCYVNAPGPQGETARLVDLDPATVAALGLHWEDGMYRVSVEPASYLPMAPATPRRVEPPPRPSHGPTEALPDTALSSP